ncbi:MAG TPA: hypothetical protein VNR65_05335 [Geobacterales bacterium]|nr:hypothetical protein [Geobacterales bacterium]
MLGNPSARSFDRFAAALIAPNLGQITERMLHDHDVPKLAQPKLSAAEVNLFLAEVFPQIDIGRVHKVEETRHGFARMRMV